MSILNTKDIADKHRAAIKSFMDERGLNTFSWSKKADLTESTLRNFLNGGNSLTSKTLANLAMAVNVTISELLGEGKAAGFYQDLFMECYDIIVAQAESMKKSLNNRELVYLSTKLYAVACEDKKNGATNISIGAARMIISS